VTAAVIPTLTVTESFVAVVFIEAIMGTVFVAGRTVGAIVPVFTGIPTVGATEIDGANVAVGKLVGYTASKPRTAVEFAVIIVLMEPTKFKDKVEVDVEVARRRLLVVPEVDDDVAIAVDLQRQEVCSAE
jgi:hypothetical protein